MADTKGGKGLHGPDKRQDALRDEGSGASGKGNVSPLNEAQHQQGQRGADSREGVAGETLRRGELPEGLARKRMGPLDKATGRGG